MADNIKFVKIDSLESNPLHEAVYRINVGHDLTQDLAFEAFRYALTQENPLDRSTQMGVLLNSILAKRPRVEEIIGFLKAAFSIDDYHPENLSEIKLDDDRKVVGYAGSGKKGIKTINISSCASIVAGTAGVVVAKSCSKSTSSTTGSSDFIELVGANTSLESDKMIEVMKKTNLGFFKIENRIPSFDKLYGGRFYAPHSLSFGLAGMVLPFKPNTLLYGLAHPNLSLLLEVLKEFNYRNVFSVTSTDNGIHFLDELSIFGNSTFMGIRENVIGNQVSININDFLKLPNYNRKSIAPSKDQFHNIKLGIDVLAGKGILALEDMISLNAGTLIYLSGKTRDLEESFLYAKEVIHSKKCIEKLIEFIDATNGNCENLKKYL